uniref:Globin family profile domain-containing protein n=1 Tax=Meloidogyne javanica TaxID=6303 RepID=A0A915LGI3_MELJA
MPDSKRLEIQSLCLESLSKIKIGTGPEEKQNGKDFYKYFFTNYPDLRVYFKGAEKYTADDVQKSERFEKQGQRILLAMHLTARVYADEKIKLKAFWTVWTGFLATKISLDEGHKTAWMTLGQDFAKAANKHLKLLGLPTAE